MSSSAEGALSSSAEGGGSAFRDFNKNRFPRLRRENDNAVIPRHRISTPDIPEAR
jgi:hypothetical protein